MTKKERVKNRRIGIIGMARSGMAAAELVLKFDGKPFVSDIKPDSELTEETARLHDLGISYETGGHTKRLLDSDFVILSPGIPRTIEIVRDIIDAGIPIFSEIEIASWLCQGKIIAVTGSNGKTTTTTLIGAMLEAAGIENIVCGNIGRPFSEVAAAISPDGYAVVEVSSFQLELIEEFQPHIALILNLTPDHLDRYDSFDDYKKAKYGIAENQAENDFLILNADDTGIEAYKINTNAKIMRFSIQRTLPAGVFQRGQSLVGNDGGKEYEILKTGEIKIPGPHNLQNAAASSLAVHLVGAEPRDIADTLRQFAGVEHRLEDLGTIAGIRFINDSKATNVDSVCYALVSVTTPIILIAGGRDKGGDFLPLLEKAEGKVKEIILVGEARGKMFKVLGKAFPVQFADDLERAVSMAFSTASPGDTVLLSPACASFDMFDNFEHRGRVFKEAVASLRNNGKMSETIES
jgi:UDP-N-acetylmuramoylalanine--D-glutamate ligase